MHALQMQHVLTMHKVLPVVLVLACVATSAEARRHYSRSTEARNSTSDVPRAAAQERDRERPRQPTRTTRTERRAQNEGTAAVIPPGWQLDPPNPGWKGYRYHSPDGQATVMFYSTPIDQDPIAEHWRNFAFRAGEDIMYLERGRGWVVASGITAARTSYRKAALDCHERVWRHIELDFPTEARSTFDPLIARVAHTLDFALANNNWAPTVAPADACEPRS